MDRSMCAHLPPPRPRAAVLPPLLLLPPPQSPGSHTLNSSHWALAWDAGSAGCIERRSPDWAAFFSPGAGEQRRPRACAAPMCTIINNRALSILKPSVENGKCATTRPPLMPPPRFVPQCCTFNAQYAMGNTMPMANANAHEPIWWSHDAHAQSATRAPRPKKKKNSRRTLSHI